MMEHKAMDQSVSLKDKLKTLFFITQQCSLVQFKICVAVQWKIGQIGEKIEENLYFH